LLKIKEQLDPEKVAIVSINVLDQEGQVKAEVEKYKMDYTVLVGRGQQLTARYKITKLPHLLIIDQDGVIQTSERFLTAEKIRPIVEQLLKKLEPKK